MDSTTEINNEIQTQKKLTIGFKASADLKEKLAKEASALGLTISSLIELKLTRNQNSAGAPDTKKIEAINEQLARLQRKVTIYENPTLLKYYEKMKNLPFDFQDSNGNDRSIRVTSPKDVFELMLASFKIDL